MGLKDKVEKSYATVKDNEKFGKYEQNMREHWNTMKRPKIMGTEEEYYSENRGDIFNQITVQNCSNLQNKTPCKTQNMQA